MHGIETNGARTRMTKPEDGDIFPDGRMLPDNNG
jgi:hypothetical protein